MARRLEDPTILVPVDVSDPEAPSTGLVDLLHPLQIVLLGYYPVPDQATPEQLRDEYEAEATAALEELAAPFADRGTEVERVLVFTRDRDETIQRVAGEFGGDAVLTAGEDREMERVLIPLKGDPNLDRIVTFAADLLGENDAAVTLFHAVASDEDAAQSEYLLRGAADRLAEDGIDPDRITWRQVESDLPVAEIAALADDHDVVVIGESEPTLRGRILGDTPSRLVDRVTVPVLVVRKAG